MDTINGFWAGAGRVAGRVDLDAVCDAIGGWANLVRASVDDLGRIGVPIPVAREWLTAPPVHTLGRALVRTSTDYPPALRTVPRPPPVVFVEGDPECLRQPAIAIVGTRGCSPYGASAAQQIAFAAARAGIVVVSGLARGIDASAHRGALAGGGRTIAVLGHGLGHTAPPSNRRLRAEIVEKGGLMLTTWPDEVPPARHTFPERNRWIAALARRVVIVEAPERSGALITAERLLDLGREEDLLVVAGPLGAESWRGSAALLSYGVKPLVDLDAFVADLVGPGAESTRHPDWLSALLAGGSLDEAARMRGVSAVEMLREVVSLELSGRVVRLPGGRYAPAGGVP